VSAPPPPPGFTIDEPAPRRTLALAVPPPPEGFTLDGEVHDGDTFGLQGGGSLRLYGADAPELKQQGWRHDMTPVAIGQQAKAIADGLVDPTGEVGTIHGYSYGRPVAPVTDNGQDVGQSLIRTGNALATPSYLKGDPRFGAYMEAERLARLNRLGVHGVYAQSPSDFRHAPDGLPDRETVAQWWDTPTPFAGLRPDIEKGYLAIQKTGSADQILAYANANGFTIDPRITRKFVTSRARSPTK
jgi:endonuclease YncB( thermonuclease family)